MTAKQLEAETGCKIMVRGRGSMRDKKKEDMNRGKPNWEHLNEELHVIIQCEDTPNRNAVKMARAAEEVRRLLIPQPEGEDELKRKQLMELAIINGTFRNDGTPTGQLQSGKGAAASLLREFILEQLSNCLIQSLTSSVFFSAPLPHWLRQWRQALPVLR
jgi:protein quaking